MLRRLCITVIGLVFIVFAMCVFVVAVEHRRWDACEDTLSKMKFKPSAHTPSEC